MRLSCGFAPRHDVVGLVRLAEELGYGRAYFADSPALYGDVWVAIARALGATRRIGVGTAVLVPSLRHVVTTAAAIADVETQAPGRLRVVLGTGFTGRRLLGQKAMKVADFAQYVRDLKALLRGETVSIDGQPCRLMQSPGIATSRPIETPVAIAANGARLLALADELSDDGVMCANAVPDGARHVTLLQSGTVLEPGENVYSDRVREAVGPALAVVYHGAYESIGEGVDRIPGGKGWREEIERFPESVRHLYVHEGHYWELTERDRANVSPELAGTTLTGTVEELRERVAALEAQGVEELLYWPFGDVARELRAMHAALA